MGASEAKRDVLFSIRPFYVDKILEGQKTVELRRRFSEAIIGSTALIYSTSPVKAVVGSARIQCVYKLPLPKLWRNHGTAACIAKSDFNAYFAGQEYGFAIMLDSVKQLKSRLTAEDLETEFGIVPPQSYRYLAQEWVALLNNDQLQATGRHKRCNSSRRPSTR